MGYGKKNVKGVRECIIGYANIAEHISIRENVATAGRMKRMYKAGYVTMLIGFFLLLCAAGGSDLERMSTGEIVITALVGIALMIAGDVLKDKKRTIRRTIASKANCSK